MKGIWLLIAAFGATLFLAGCGGGEPTGFVPATDPPTEQAMGRAVVQVNWPTGGGSSGTRLIPGEATKIVIEAHCPELELPITATINKPDTTATIYLPAGANREFYAFAYNDEDVMLLAGKKTGVVVPAGEIVNITLPLIGLNEPDNDFALTGTPLEFNDGYADAMDAVDARYNDFVDHFRFTPDAMKEYNVGFYPLYVGIDGEITVECFIAGEVMESVGVMTGIASETFETLTFVAPSSNPIVVRVTTEGENTRVYYRLVVWESGQVGITID